MYKWEVSQTNNGFKTAIFESYLEIVFCKPAGNNAATFYFVLLKKHTFAYWPFSALIEWFSRRCRTSLMHVNETTFRHNVVLRISAV